MSEPPMDARFGDALSVEALIDAALAEDLGTGDVTSRWTVPDGAGGEAEIVAKATGVVAGVEVAAAVFRRFDPRLELEVDLVDGDAVVPGDRVLRVTGSLESSTPSSSALARLAPAFAPATTKSVLAETLDDSSIPWRARAVGCWTHVKRRRAGEGSKSWPRLQAAR